MLQYVTRLPVLLGMLVSTSLFIVTVFASNDPEPQALPEIPSKEIQVDTAGETVGTVSTTTASSSANIATTTSTSSTILVEQANDSESLPESSRTTVTSGVPAATEEWTPLSPTDCFTDEAINKFGHPGMCLRFFHQGF